MTRWPDDQTPDRTNFNVQSSDQSSEFSDLRQQSEKKSGLILVGAFAWFTYLLAIYYFFFISEKLQYINKWIIANNVTRVTREEGRKESQFYFLLLLFVLHINRYFILLEYNQYNYRRRQSLFFFSKKDEEGFIAFILITISILYTLYYTVVKSILRGHTID